jgi:hypothetical protein
MGRKRLGKWRVEGDELCVEFEDSGGCFEVRLAGARIQMTRSDIDSLPLEGILQKPTSGR